MQQLAISNGDLVLGQGGFAPVTGRARVIQDLAGALREPVGTDRFHPGYGSMLPAYIGQVLNDDLTALVEAEIYRVVQNYMMSRVAQMQEGQLSGRRTPLRADEVVSNITSIDFRQRHDRLDVRVSLATMAPSPVTIVTSVGV
jgi:phage baseplate assembly protein W